VTCCVVDSVVITFGVVGFGTALAGDATLTATAAWAGTAFLLVYAAERLRSAVGPSRELDGIVPSPTLRRRALATALAVSMLNPQLYLDAFVLMGGVAAPLQHTERIAFAVGAPMRYSHFQAEADSTLIGGKVLYPKEVEHSYPRAELLMGAVLPERMMLWHGALAPVPRDGPLWPIGVDPVVLRAQVRRWPIGEGPQCRPSVPPSASQRRC
jgi:hypothetical protein